MHSCQLTSNTSLPPSARQTPSPVPGLSPSCSTGTYPACTDTACMHADRSYTQQSIGALLPQEQWNEEGLLRQRVCTVAQSLSSVAYIRIADKSSAMLFGFCHQWVWDATIEFLSNEGYTHQLLTHAHRIHKALKHIVKKNSWPANPSSVLPVLYLIGKAKSLVKCSILWRPIAAVVEPQIQRFDLRMAARAFTLLRTLISEIPGCFLVLRISDMNDWFHGLSEWECQVARPGHIRPILPHGTRRPRKPSLLFPND